MRSKSREDWVDEFRKAGDSPNFDPENLDLVRSNMIMNCIVEEANEFFEAAAAYEIKQDEESRANLCKEWADMAYVVSQAACYYDIPADAAFVRVAENNLTKVGDNGKLIKREDGKILKPEGYVPADMKGL